MTTQQPPAADARYEGVRAFSRPVIYMLGVLAAWPLLMRAVNAVTRPSATRITGDQYRSMQLVSTIFSSVQSILQLVMFIFFLIWFHRLYSAIRDEQGTTRYSPGFAVGCWFIPFANFAMPFIAVSDAWKRKMGATNAWVVPLWWFTWLGLIALRITMSLMQALHAGGREAWVALGYLTMLTNIATYGAWLLIVHWMTERTGGKAIA